MMATLNYPQLVGTLLISCAFLLTGTLAQSTPSIWLGEAPFCTSKPEDCALFDLNYVKSTKSGVGATCWEGRKVLCEMKQVNRSSIKTPAAASLLAAAPPATKASATVLEVLTFNIFQRPFVVSHDGQYVRTCHIPRAVTSKFPQLDLLVIQEGFLGGCIDGMTLRQMMSQYGFAYSTPTVGIMKRKYTKNYPATASVTFTNGGVFVVSRWPILQHQSIIYTNTTTLTADAIARKGVMYARILKANSTVFHVFATHMQAQDGLKEDATRYRQAGEIRDFMDKINPPASEPVLVIGDMNSDRLSEAGHVNSIMQRLQVQVPPTVGLLNATYDPRLNDVVEPGAVPQWIDYVWYSQRHRQPVVSHMEAVYLTTDAPITYCLDAPLYPFFVKPTSSLCAKTHSTRFMSDHFPVHAVLEY